MASPSLLTYLPISSPPTLMSSLPSSQSSDDDDLHSHHTPSSSRRVLAQVLARKERDAQQMHQLLKLTLAKLDEQSQRATDAERRATECLVRARTAIDARAHADTDAAAARAELALYKMQLEQAQREISRAQEYLDGLEARRHDAEEDAARARSVARKLQEERASEAAREQGKQEGYNEGLRHGILLGRREAENNRPRSRRRQEEDHDWRPQSRSRRRQEEDPEWRPQSRPRRPADVHFTQDIPESPQQSITERSFADDQRHRVITGYVPQLLHLHIFKTSIFFKVSAQISLCSPTPYATTRPTNHRMTQLHLHLPFHPHHPNDHDHDPSHALALRPLHLSQPVRAHTHLMTIQRLRSSSPSPSPPRFHPWGHCRCIHRRAPAHAIRPFGSRPTTGYHVHKTLPATVVSPSSYPRLMSS